MELTGPEIAIGGGLIIGLVLGATIQRSNFCMMGAVADFAVSGDLRRLRAWMLTIALAIVLTQALSAASGLDLEQVFYLGPRLPLASLVVGGLLFGFGMVIACGCASRNLVNLGMGDLRALIALIIMGIFAYATMRGLLAYPRLWLVGAGSIDVPSLFGAGGQGLHQLLARDAAPGTGTTSIAVAIMSVPLAFFGLRPGRFRIERRLLVAAVIISVCIAAGWYVNGVLAIDDFDPVPLLSLRFVAPVGESLLYVMTFSGASANFGIASVGGVLLGAFAAAITRGQFRWQAFEDIHDLSRYAIGGALMGVGGVLSLGCTVGQGLSGVSTLSLGSFIALASIITGGILGVRYLERGSVLGALLAVTGRR